MKASVIILLFFAIGVILGIFNFIPDSFLNYNSSFIALCVLMFVVGFSVGHQPQTIQKFKNLPLRIILLPIITLLGTWVGSLAASLTNTYSITENLAIGSGLGYYSLTSILITQYKGTELGALALLANIFREIITLLFLPLMVQYFGKLAPIAAGGATTMDTTLPGIMRFSGKDYGMIAIYHGFVADLSVPFLVAFWCSV